VVGPYLLSIEKLGKRHLVSRRGGEKPGDSGKKSGSIVKHDIRGSEGTAVLLMRVYGTVSCFRGHAETKRTEKAGGVAQSPVSQLWEKRRGGGSDYDRRLAGGS